MNSFNQMDIQSLKNRVLRLYNPSQDLKNQLARFYIPFKVFLIIYFSSHITPMIDPIHTSWTIVIASIFCSTCNLLTSHDLNSSLKIKEWDTVILITVLVTLLPFIEWISASIGLAFCITSILRFQQGSSN